MTDQVSEIAKVCKKHGELQIENTYLMKTRYGSLIRMCSICRRGYKNDWAKKNPEKVKISQKKQKEKRTKELSDGVLKKTCIRHGELPITKIRVDARGTKVCRLCSNEDKLKSRKKVDPTREKYRKWLYSDKDRVQRYYKNDKPKKLKRQMKAYYKMKENDPVKWKQKQKQQLNLAAKARERLDDSYIKGILRTMRLGGKKNRFYRHLKCSSFPKEVIELVKTQIKLKRKLKELKCQK